MIAGAPELPLRQRAILRFWAPLAATWLMMAIEGPVLAALIARLASPEFNLAAYGVAFAFAIIVEAPVIMMMSAATALAGAPTAYRRLRRFNYALIALITLTMLFILIPPVYRFIFERLVGLPPEVLHLTRRSLWLLLPWPGAIGYRRFYQGILIRHGYTRRVAYGTLTRVAAMLVTGLALYAHGGIEGAWLGAAALSAGVCVEAIATRLLARDALAALRRLPEESAAEAPGYLKILDFYTPLALTAWLTMAVQPLVTFFMGQARYSLESLAVLPVIGSLGFIFRAPGLAVQEVGIALLARGEVQRPPVKRFASILALVLSGGLCLLAFTPLSSLWFERISGLSPALAAFSRVPLMLQVAIPALVVMNALQRAILVGQRRTRPITWATAAEVAAVILLLLVGVQVLDLAGAVAASLALLGGRAVGVLVLWPALRRR
jgi:hypothetical protein